MQVSNAVTTACGVSRLSTPKHDIPGDVLDDFSMAGTFLAQPPPVISVSASKRAKATAPSGHQNQANASMPAFAAGVPSLFHRIPRLPSLHQLLLPFTHRLPPLLGQDLSLSLPAGQPAHGRQTVRCRALLPRQRRICVHTYSIPRIVVHTPQTVLLIDFLLFFVRAGCFHSSSAPPQRSPLQALPLMCNLIHAATRLKKCLQEKLHVEVQAKHAVTKPVRLSLPLSASLRQRAHILHHCLPQIPSTFAFSYPSDAQTSRKTVWAIDGLCKDDKEEEQVACHTLSHEFVTRVIEWVRPQTRPILF